MLTVGRVAWAGGVDSVVSGEEGVYCCMWRVAYKYWLDVKAAHLVASLVVVPGSR